MPQSHLLFSKVSESLWRLALLFPKQSLEALHWPLRRTAIELRIYLDFFHAVGHRVAVDALNGWSQAFPLEFRAHVTTFLLLAAGHHAPPEDIWVWAGRWVRGEKKKVAGVQKKKNGFTFFFTVHCFHSVVIVRTHPLHGLIGLHFLKHGGRFREEYSSSSVSFRRKESKFCLLL